MAGNDFTTKTGRAVLHWADPQVQEVISILRAVRVSGDLLTGAADSVSQGRNEFHQHTLADLGCHLEDLATKGLVILGYDNPKPQAAAQGGAARGVKTPDSPSQVALEATDPLKKGKAVIALFRSNYDLLNSVISKSPEIKNQLGELQGEAAELMAKFDDLLIDLDFHPGPAPEPQPEGGAA